MKGCVAVVTGAASGIGLGIAHGLAARGARVAVVDLNLENARSASSAIGNGAIPIAADVTQPDQVGRMFREAAALGEVSLLVNNAGIVKMGASDTFAFDDWKRVIDVNLTAVFLCSQAAASRMIPAGGGSIVNIASIAARAAAPGFAAYSASKGGVLSLTRALAVEWAPHRIRVNSVSPGTIDTPLSREARARDPDAFARRDRRVPITRPGATSDVADAVAWLAGDESGYVTGQDIKVDGGLLSQHPGYVP